MITAALKKEIVSSVIDGFLSGKSDEKLASISQEEIDAYVVPLFSGLEDEAVRVIGEKSSEAFKRVRSDDTKPWWED